MSLGEVRKFTGFFCCIEAALHILAHWCRRMCSRDEVVVSVWCEQVGWRRDVNDAGCMDKGKMVSA